MEKRKGVRFLARAGYAARGVVYLIVGVFAFLAASGSGSVTDTEGALEALLRQPFGWFLLGATAIGLVGYGIWGLARCFLDADHKGSGAKGIAMRTAYLVSGLTHFALAVAAFGLLGYTIGGDGGGGGDPTGGALATILSNPIGRILALAAPLIPLGIGIAHFVKAWRGKFMKYLSADADICRRLKPIGQAGLTARGVVFVMIAVLMFYAGAIYDPSQAPGLGDALSALRGLPFGWIVLGATGLGLVAFAVFCFVQAVYRRVDIA